MLPVSAAEVSIAYTNLMNSVVSLCFMTCFIRKGLQIRRNKLWFLAYLFLMLNCFIGFILHGFKLPDFENIALWSVLYLLLGVMLSRYVIALRHDVLNEQESPKGLLIGSLVVSFVIAIINIIDYHYSYPLFSLYAIINVVSILVLLSRKIKTDKRYIWYFVAILFFIAGSIVQAMSFIRFRFIFEFDNNGLYHLLLLVFQILQFIGILKTEKPLN